MAYRFAMVCTAAVVAFGAIPARAGPYSDELGKCLVRSTTREDREALARWMFIAFANHPAVKSLVSVSKAQADAANKTIGELFMRLLTASCKDDARRALQYEGAGAIEAGFQVLGLVAGRELATSPDVAAGLAALEKHIDKNRLQGLTKNAASAGQ